MSVEIPVTFTHDKKEYTGYLSEVKGAGGICFHLMINNSYLGQLILTDHGWAFHPQNIEWLKEFTDYFESVVTAWYE